MIESFLLGMARKVELELLLECRCMDLGFCKRESRFYTEIQREMGIIRNKLEELRMEELLPIAGSKIPEKEIIR